jgi:predicted CoA-substrate-specific enzyme activase
LGSTTSKSVVLKNGTEIVGKAITKLGAGTQGPAKSIAEAISDARIVREDISYSIGTGYGRNSFVDFMEGDSQLSELTCHARGAKFLVPTVRTVIDIGGQDSKVLSLSEKGKLMSFVMNEKCAAGTGRFIEIIARVLGLKINQMAEVSSESKNIVNISSVCTVFAESEVISQLAKNVDISDIVAGVHRSVANKVSGLVKRVGIRPDIVMTGGVAQNHGVVLALEEVLKCDITVPENAQLAGALGAALYAFDMKTDLKLK